MPTPALPLPPDVRVTALRGLVKLLQADQDLNRVVRTWRVWDGGTADTVTPSLVQYPQVRLTASPEASNWAHNSGQPTSRQPIRLQVDTVVAGTDQMDSLVLWGAIERAVFRGGVAALHALGISGAEVIQPGWGSANPDAKTVGGSGVIRLDIYVPAGGA